ncbi:hypothetical protein [Mixta gaviniae]|uniref:Uncharacterized protein n=1 Tax=Mixta gaviniae TaxID=665914 RepID=A0A2L0ICR3_9GAMM|nr:hypothetical protein [Mixta gaviniae]AUX92297.1 hypothetical protein C2E15_03840 [Mixta gaviniae]
MEIYGYENEEGDLMSLQEMTLKVTVDELKILSSFIINTVNLMEEHKENFGHEHLSDFTKNCCMPEVIITK